ncbi:RecB family-like endonuclease [Pyrolobus fumarii 1A]|uniref:RecB family-like endonuclease n=1 Tax=Pyrolobus fumarii (strain DSM 11204 / 1A) TaxID=694429 RepID=G0EEB2_PYRF1|nr:restriction endonuclease [Pyrolobus fumarii]AEM38806.1 RecB family-like endonuclease [Pyrolobus fumarii 1A]
MARSGEKRWRSSERIALHVLEEMGYRILETHKRIIIDGVEVAEVDAIVEAPSGEKYAVEIKAGRIDVTTLRQAYVNALLLDAKPMVVARGFADEAAEKLAEKLGVETVILSDSFLVDADELEEIVKEALASTIEDVIAALSRVSSLRPRDVELLRAIADSETLEELAKRLGVGIRDAARMLAEARRAGVVPRSLRSYAAIRGYARLALALLRLSALVDTLESSVERLERIASTLG